MSPLPLRAPFPLFTLGISLLVSHCMMTRRRHHLNFINCVLVFLALGVSGMGKGGGGDKTSMFGVLLFFSLLNPFLSFLRRL